MRQIVEKIIEQFGDNGEVSVVFTSLNDDHTWDFSINAQKVLPAASIIKLCILASVMKKIEKGELSFNDVATIQEGDVFGDFNAQHHPLRTPSYTIGDLCRLMIDLSDNLASNMLIRVAGGMDQINSDIRENGLQHTVLQRKFLDFETQKKGLENYTNAEDTVKMVLYFTQKADRNSTIAQEMLSILNAQGDKDYLSQYMPEVFFFAHKTGHIPGSMHNVGIITTPYGRRYIISVLTTKLKSDVEGKRFLNNLGEAIFKRLSLNTM